MHPNIFIPFIFILHHPFVAHISLRKAFILIIRLFSVPPTHIFCRSAHHPVSPKLPLASLYVGVEPMYGHRTMRVDIRRCPPRGAFMRINAWLARVGIAHTQLPLVLGAACPPRVPQLSGRVPSFLCPLGLRRARANVRNEAPLRRGRPSPPRRTPLLDSQAQRHPGVTPASPVRRLHPEI